MKMNKEWSMCNGENSKEVEIQNNRIKREKEVFHTTLVEIPPNPKEPWDLEMDYDDSLTPEIPTEQLPDEENDNNNITTEPTQTETIPEHNLGPDLELLAVLLKNPQIVFALTAGQGGSLTNEQMVKLLDAMKENAASGGSIDSLVNRLLVERKTEVKVEVSLPSPTPSTNNSVVTSGWRTESGKTQFSRQSVTVNGDAYTIPRVNFQETSVQVNSPISHQRSPDLTQKATSPAIHHRFSDMDRNIPASSHQRFSDIVPDRRNIPVASHVQEVNNNTSSSNAYFSPGQSGSHVWAGRESLDSSSYSSTNYNAYGTSTREFVQPWVRNGRGEPRFDSWSPDDSPFRSREYVDYNNIYRDTHSHSRSYGGGYRAEMSRMQNDNSRFRDRGGRNGGTRWRDRRR